MRSNVKRTSGSSALVLGALFVAGSPASADSVLDFIVQSAHKHNFYGCDAAIRMAFKHAEGAEDARVNTGQMEQTKTRSLTMTVTHGRVGDTVLGYVVFSKTASQCVYVGVSTLTFTDSCLAHTSRDHWKFVDQSGDYYWFENAGGVDLLNNPVNAGCVQTYSIDGAAPLSK